MQEESVERFFYWIHERIRIQKRKDRGDLWPWTGDPILQQYKFTNAYREQDKTTVWFREKIRDPLSWQPEVYMATGASVDTWYYYRIVRDGNDATLTRYTSDANRTSNTSGVSITISGFVSTVSWVESTKLKFLDGTGYSSNQPFYVKNVRIYNGVTSI